MAKKETKKAEEKAEVKNTVTISDAGPCKKKIEVEVPESVIKEELSKQYKDLQHEAQIPGFRKGRAPIRLLEKRFSKDIIDQVKLQILAKASDEAMKENKVDSLGDPNIDYEKITLPESGPMKFDFEVEVRPEFELPATDGIEVNKPKIEVTEEQITNQLTALRRYAGVWAPVEGGKVENGDQVIADVELKAEGETESTKVDNDEITVRKFGFVGKAIPVENLVEVLEGAKQGDEKSTTVEVATTFYDEKFRGKKVEVKISVKEIKRINPAELNEEFFKRYEAANEAELKEKIKEEMGRRNEQQAQDEMRNQVYKYLLDNTSFELPADVVAAQSARVLQNEFTNLLYRGVSQEEIKEKIDELRAGSEERAREQLKVFFIMDKLGEKLGVEVSEEEINGHIARIAAQRGRRPEKMREEMLRDGSLAQFSMSVREDKIVAKLLETSKVSEVEAEKLEKKPAKKAAKKETKEEANGEEPAKKASKKKKSEQ